MNKLEKLYTDAINAWRDNKGCGTLIVPHPFDKQIIILTILQNIYVKNPLSNILVIVNDWNARMNLIDYLTHQECEENNAEFKNLIQQKNIVIITSNIVNTFNNNYKNYNLTVLFDIPIIEDKHIFFCERSRFKLGVFSSIPPVDNGLFKIAPILPIFSQKDFDEVRTSTPVEDIWIGVDILPDSDTGKLLDYYKQYISTSIDIFGNFDIMNEARVGNDKLNISATQICEQIAQENGWNAHLDMSIPINVQVDEVYNPSSIRERANKTFEIIRLRNQLLSDYEEKLNEIVKIVTNHPNSKILIINKRGVFANKVTERLNSTFGDVICGNYHDNVDSIPELDAKGNPVYYKSGQKAGKPKYLGAIAQQTRNMSAFNSGYLSVLSTNSAPNKKLAIDVDVVIITSPQCETIESYLYRLDGVGYPNNKIELYTLFVRNSVEEQKLRNKPTGSNHTIVNKCENEVVYENNSDFIVVD